MVFKRSNREWFIGMIQTMGPSTIKVAYFDCFSGASGNMILGSMLNAGLSVEVLHSELDKLHLRNYEIQVEKVIRQGIEGVLAKVISKEAIPKHRYLKDLEAIVDSSDLHESVKLTSKKVFRRLAEAEAKVHSISIDQVHFHEVGALDAIIDVVGSVAGIKALGIEKVYCSPIHLGSGLTECAHGILPVPAPATAELIKGAPVYGSRIQGELLTPTGAAILTTLAFGFGAMPEMVVHEIGYGAGTLNVSIPNLLRLVIGEVSEKAQNFLQESVTVIETNIDDMNPQIYDYIIEKSLEMGVLDVFLTTTQMKKNRPGTLLTVICPSHLKTEFADFIMKETTSIGLRWREEKRIKAHRSIKEYNTLYGPIRFKIARLNDTTVNVSPEYEDCRRLAMEKRIALKQVMYEATRAVTEIKDTL